MPTPESFGGYSGIAGFQNSGRKAGDGTDVFVEGVNIERGVDRRRTFGHGARQNTRHTGSAGRKGNNRPASQRRDSAH